MNDCSRTFPLAMEAPGTTVTPLGGLEIRRALEMSRQSPRKRIILPLHKSADSTLHRMLNAIQPGSYVRPHRHEEPPKAESMLVLQGSLGVVIFDASGSVKSTYTLSPHGEHFALDIEAGVFHTILALLPDTVLFEVKPGPYTRSTDKDFATWAPGEYTPEAEEFLGRMRELFMGDSSKCIPF